MKKLLTESLLPQIREGIELAKAVGEHRQGIWEQCWKDKDDPDYFSDIVRYNGEFYEAPGFERKHLASLREELYSYFQDEVSEFGCGSGQNLKPLIGRKLHGYDWAESAIDRVKSFAHAERFDMFHPRPLGLKGGVLTVHAMEQLGDKFGPFLQFLLDEKPSICVHIEPIEELYEDNLLDDLALSYHRKRRYLSGFLTALKGKDILEVRRTYVGSLFHEAYSVIVWKP